MTTATAPVVTPGPAAEFRYHGTRRGAVFGLESGTTINARGGRADTGPAGGYELGDFVTVLVP